MFEDPELPDFDSMSQEELIEWLEQLAKSHSEAASEFIDDIDGDVDTTETESLADDEDWSDWRDETVKGASAHIEDDGFATVDELPGGAEDPPVDLSLFDVEDTGATASLDWLDEITAAQNADNVPNFSDLQAQASAAGHGHELPAGDETDDPLDWLNRLDSNGVSAASNDPDFPDDFDETWEDDESLDDLEDESLYSRSPDDRLTFLESLLGLEDRETEKYSTQSMAPVPDNQTSEPEEAVAAAPPDRADSLTRAFMIQEREADLEAWYAERLRAITSAGKMGASAKSAAAPAPAAAPSVKPAKPPPPGLAAAINSARGKVKAESLNEALLDYEKLLGTSAGLQWVVHDMRGLIAETKYRGNPSVHRVLGDALMRQGHLDAALNIYRHALSLL